MSEHPRPAVLKPQKKSYYGGVDPGCVACPLRSFASLCYSADGESILAGGQSKFVCIYNVKEQMLMKKFEISCNLSFDGMEVWPGSSRSPGEQ